MRPFAGVWDVLGAGRSPCNMGSALTIRRGWWKTMSQIACKKGVVLAWRGATLPGVVAKIVWWWYPVESVWAQVYTWDFERTYLMVPRENPWSWSKFPSILLISIYKKKKVQGQRFDRPNILGRHTLTSNPFATSQDPTRGSQQQRGQDIPPSRLDATALSVGHFFQ